MLTYAQAINAGAYNVAFSFYTPAMQQPMGGVAKWSSGLDTSYWTSLSVLRTSGTEDAITAEVLIETVQDAQYGPEGQTCSQWDMEYSMVWSEGFWQIDAATLLADPIACE